jgi:Metallo-peptidase family M12B Reprolysin-like
MPIRPVFVHALGALLGLAAGSATAAGLWRDAQAPLALRAQGPQPARYRSLQLDTVSTRAALLDAVSQRTPFALPLPEGGFARFVLEDSDTLPAELAQRYQLLSLRGRDTEGRRLRLDLSPDLGLQALVFDTVGSWVVQPALLGPEADYLSFRRAEAPVTERFYCSVHGHEESADEHFSAVPQPDTVTGASRRVLRTAVAATGEYTAVFGGTVSGGLAAVTTAVNRINEVYGNEFSVTLQLVANNNLLIYTNGTTDPYTNNNGSTMLGQNQTSLDKLIGPANYDLGHVFSTGGGGVATLNAVCNNSTKARGVTGRGNPVGDPFYIDYVAHEMGHQFGGAHTFNSTVDDCNGNRTASAAYEPGSGSTIQAYAGICGSDDLQPNSDPYFHAKSLEQMQARLDAVPGCGTSTPNPSAAPVIPVMSASYVIPAATPFELLAPQATDADGDALTYDWEEYDLGGSTAVNVDNGTSPIIRSFNPVASRARIVPRLASLLNNTTVTGEILPTQNRTAMNFRLTVRDNHAGGGRSSSANLPAIRVVATGTPFAVTAPNTAVNWNIGQPNPVTWNVGGTTAAPISCANVDITLSIDGGLTWPVTLATATPNDGSQNVTVPPGNATAQARVRVRCSTSIFFDISNVNFTIANTGDGIFENSFDP